MTIALPSSPAPAQFTFRPRLFSSYSEGATEEQFIRRLGDRWAADIRTPRLKPEPDARLWTEALGRASMTGEEVSIVVPQPWLEIGTPGTPLVNGGSQTGTSLVSDGFTSGYVMRLGQFFSVLSSGRRSLHRMTADVTMTGGAGTLTFEPPLRFVPADNAVLEVAAPVLQGRVSGDASQWTLVPARVEPLSFSIEERR